MPAVQDAQTAKLAALLAGGQQGGATAQPAPTPTTAALQSASQQLDGANPQGATQVLRQMSQDLAQLYLMASQRMPEATKDLDSARQALQRAITIFTKAAATQQAVAPIVNNAGIGPVQPTPQQGMPDLSALLGMQ